MTRLGHSIGVALVLGSLAGPALGADAIVEGEVLTEKGVPVTGFPVVIGNEGGQVVAVTDESGHFAAEGLAPGTYQAYFAKGSNGSVEFVIPESDAGFLFMGKDGAPATVDLGTISVPTGGYGSGALPAN